MAEEPLRNREPVEAGLGEGPVPRPALEEDPGPVQEPVPLQKAKTGRRTRKERIGLVVSDKPEKTVVVSVETLVQHPRYKKRVRRSKRFMVHDEHNEARAGDTVRIVETRPLSARKRWRLAHIISRAE